MIDNLLQQLSGKKVLVTGANGFIGSRLVKILSKNPKIKVFALVHNYSHSMSIARLSVAIIDGDVSNKENMLQIINNYDIVFHCAYANKGNKGVQKNVNVQGTKNVLDACLKNNVNKIIHVSTMVVYGTALDSNINEDLPYKYSNNTYADTKIDAEKIVKQYIREKNLNAVILQPTIVYGPWSPSFIRYPISVMNKGKKILPNNGKGICNALYIDDLIQAFLLAATKREALGERFLISGDETLYWKEFYTKLNELFDSNRLSYIPNKEIKKILHKEKRKKSTFSQIKRLLTKKSTFDFMIGLPVIKYPYMAIRSIISEEFRKKIKNKIVKGDNNNKNNNNNIKSTNSIVIEDYSSYKMLCATGKVSIDKARKKLGYKPQYNLSEGLNITKKWIKWSNILNSN